MRRNWFIWAIVIGVASIALAALIMRLTADDDSGNPTTTAWADSVCTSLATWKTSIVALTDVSGESLDAETLNEKIDDADAATSTLVSELKDLGPPDLESGDALKEELSGSADAIQSSVDALKEGAAQASEAGTPAEFLQELATLGPQFQALLDSLAKTVDDLKSADVAEDASGELEAAFDDAESCQELESDG